MRIQLHPATDLAARGARYGTALDVRSDGAVAVHVDATGRRHWFRPRDVMPDEPRPLSDQERETFWKNWKPL